MPLISAVMKCSCITSSKYTSNINSRPILEVVFQPYIGRCDMLPDFFHQYFQVQNTPKIQYLEYFSLH